MRGRWRLSAWVVAIAVLGSGCAYYNTFYAAKKNFREAERQYEASGQEHPAPNVLDLYQHSIDKSAKVLTDYPESKWADDARYLIAMAHLRREDWEKARSGFEDLIANHPKSKLVPDSRLGIGMSLLGLGDHEGARQVLEQTLVDYPKFKRRNEVVLELAENAAERRDYRTAIQGYNQLMESDPDDDLRRRVLLARGTALLDVDAPDSALADFSALAELQSQPERRYEAELQMGECLERLGRFDDAVALYSRLARQMPDPNHLPRTLLGNGRTLNEVGRHDEALAIFERVVKDFPASSFGAEAQYQIGVTYEDYLNDLEKAKEAYSKVKEVAPSSEFAGLAEDRQHSIELYGEYRAEMSSGDESEKRAEANLKLAELSLFRMRKVPEALAAYQAVEKDLPQSSTAPRAAYAVAWIQEHELGDSLAAVASYRHVYDAYPQTEHGVVAGVRAGVLAADSLPIYLGQVLRIKAAADSAVALAHARAAADSLLAAGGVDSLGAPNPDAAATADSLLALHPLGADSGRAVEMNRGEPLPQQRPPVTNQRHAAMNPFVPAPSAAARPDTTVPPPAPPPAPAPPDTMAAASPPDTTAQSARPDTTAAVPDSSRAGGAP
jgi:TolA-binding protein